VKQESKKDGKGKPGKGETQVAKQEVAGLLMSMRNQAQPAVEKKGP